jgi:hypothetical protein
MVFAKNALCVCALLFFLDMPVRASGDDARVETRTPVVALRLPRASRADMIRPDGLMSVHSIRVDFLEVEGHRRLRRIRDEFRAIIA